MDYASVNFHNTQTERNDGYGIYVDHTRNFDFFGGYAEHNHPGYAQKFATAGNVSGYTGDGTEDSVVYLTENTRRAAIMGGR